MAFVVENVSGEIVAEHHAGIAYRDSDNGSALLFWTNRPNEFRREVEEICREIQENVYRAMKLLCFRCDRLLCGYAGSSLSVLRMCG